MPSYKVPVQDMKFILQDHLKVHENAAIPGHEMLDDETIDAVLNGAARICEEELVPANLPGDAEGCSLENGIVRTPDVYKKAYKAWAESGFNAVSSPEEWGGMGLPQVLAMCMSEMAASSNHALSMYFGLTAAATGALAGGADWDFAKHYVPKMTTGEWCGTMNLTEPHSGTDLKLMRTKAVPQDDGTYRITGTKIFISGGDHDLADNIIHMVIAKVPGEDGKLADDLSTVNFFMVPKFLVNEDGSMGARNGVTVGSIEKKMGIKGSATCVLNFEDAVAYKMGARSQTKISDKKDGEKSSAQGMAGMFNMMNVARLGVGMQGMALASTAYQNAVEYTKERLQGRSISGTKNPDGPADPIIVHPDVRRMLMTCRAFVEGARALTYWVSAEFAKARNANSDEARQAVDVAMLLTPVIKAYFTDMGVECTNMAMQCFGGHGYVHEHGMEQFVRDARILPIYEGANGVQALDLVGRKLPMKGGSVYGAFVTMVTDFIKANDGVDGMEVYTGPLKAALDDLNAATGWLMEAAGKDRDNAGASSAAYLKIFGLVMIGWTWAGLAKTAKDKLAEGTGDAAFYEAKLVTARFWMEQMMPDTKALVQKVSAGAETMMALSAEQF